DRLQLTINGQRFTVNGLRLTVNCQRSTIYCQRSTIYGQRSTVNDLLSTFYLYSINLSPSARKKHLPQKTIFPHRAEHCLAGGNSGVYSRREMGYLSSELSGNSLRRTIPHLLDD